MSLFECSLFHGGINLALKFVLVGITQNGSTVSGRIFPYSTFSEFVALLIQLNPSTTSEMCQSEEAQRDSMKKDGAGWRPC